MEALVVSIDDPVAADSDEEDELNDHPPTISIQQAKKMLETLTVSVDANMGAFSEVEITFIQGLTSKTQSLWANRQIQSAIPFPRIPRLLKNDY